VSVGALMFPPASILLPVRAKTGRLCPRMFSAATTLPGAPDPRPLLGEQSLDPDRDAWGERSHIAFLDFP
jgi:hypothetical protein